MKTFAAIDVGSFELEMGIYEMSPNIGVRRIEHLRHVIALGSDTYTTGKISGELIEELCEVLLGFTKIMGELKVDSYRAYATSAMREASNAAVVLDRIKVRTGLDVSIISNSEQRFIGYKALAAHEKDFGEMIKQTTALVDVSFGSMQITIYDGGKMISTQNLPLGVLRIKERYGHIESENADAISIISDFIDGELLIYKKLHLRKMNITSIIGLGECIWQIFGQFSDKKKMVSKSSYDAMYENITSMSGSRLEDELAINPEFAGVMIPCAIIFKRVFEIIGARDIWVPGSMFIDGIAYHYASEKKIIKTSHNYDGDIISTAKAIAKRYRDIESHGEHIEEYVLQIFDAMKKRHGLSTRDRLLLQLSAILQGCGKFISMKDAAISSYNIISQTEIIGISHDERMLIANIARNTFQESGYGDSSLRGAKLTAILRLANSLDRSHRKKAISYAFKLDRDEFTIVAKTDMDLTLERVSFRTSSAYFREVFGIEPILKQKK